MVITLMLFICTYMWIMHTALCAYTVALCSLLLLAILCFEKVSISKDTVKAIMWELWYALLAIAIVIFFMSVPYLTGETPWD